MQGSGIELALASELRWAFLGHSGRKPIARSQSRSPNPPYAKSTQALGQSRIPTDCPIGRHGSARYGGSRIAKCHTSPHPMLGHHIRRLHEPTCYIGSIPPPQSNSYRLYTIPPSPVRSLIPPSQSVLNPPLSTILPTSSSSPSSCRYPLI